MKGVSFLGVGETNARRGWLGTTGSLIGRRSYRVTMKSSTARSSRSKTGANQAAFWIGPNPNFGYVNYRAANSCCRLQLGLKERRVTANCAYPS